MEVRRMTGVLGAQVSIPDVKTLSDSQVSELRDLVCEHLVVVIPSQSLTAQQQAEFSLRWGQAGVVPFIEPSPDHPNVIRVLKEASDGNAFNFGGSWHSDFSFQPEPPAFTMLHAIDIPPYGGDTLWSSLVAAYNSLDQDNRDKCASLTAIHTARDAYSTKMQSLHSGLSSMTIICDDTADDWQRHPLVCVHPETGKNILFYNRAYVRDLEGLDDSEKVTFLEWLYSHTTEARFTCRHRWSNGDLAIWDNRSAQHYALNDYTGFRRELHRTTVAGTRPRMQ